MGGLWAGFRVVAKAGLRTGFRAVGWSLAGLKVVGGAWQGLGLRVGQG